jgi:hypothetical protein
MRGDRVKVTRGPFAGFNGLFAGMALRDRVSALLVRSARRGRSRCR